MSADIRSRRSISAFCQEVLPATSPHSSISQIASWASLWTGRGHSYFLMKLRALM